jgi:hypothetical protein
MAAELALKAGRLEDAKRHADALAGMELDAGLQGRLEAVREGL